MRKSTTAKSSAIGRVPISQFKSDVDRLTRAVQTRLHREVATQLLQRLAGDPRFPYETGRLQSSGFAFVGSELVAESNRGHRGLVHEARTLKQAGAIYIQFSTPKPVKRGKVFYREGGEKWFNYAKKVLSKAMVVNQHLNAADSLVGKVLDELWWNN